MLLEAVLLIAALKSAIAYRAGSGGRSAHTDVSARRGIVVKAGAMSIAMRELPRRGFCETRSFFAAQFVKALRIDLDPSIPQYPD